MEVNRYQLLRYRSKADRLTCPSCGQSHVLAPYIDLRTGQIIDESCGRCNREESCGYHLPPREFFARHPDKAIDWIRENKSQNVLYVLPTKPTKQIQYFPPELMQACQNTRFYHKNSFWLYLSRTYKDALANEAFERYQLGTSNAYGGACVFPLIDSQGCASAQVIGVDASTGKTIRYSSGKRATNWLHRILIRKHEKEATPVPEWLVEYDEKADKYPFCFGLHLAGSQMEKTVCIVESAKTAVVMSIQMPEFLWLAVGSLSNLNSHRLQPIKHRVIVLVPDAGKGEAEWRRKLQLLKQEGFQIDIVHMDLPNGEDIADVELSRDESNDQDPQGNFKVVTSEGPSPASQPTDNCISDFEAQKQTDTDVLLCEEGYPASWNDTTPIPGYEERKLAFITKHAATLSAAAELLGLDLKNSVISEAA